MKKKITCIYNMQNEIKTKKAIIEFICQFNRINDKLNLELF